MVEMLQAKEQSKAVALLIKNPPFFVNHMMVLLHARALCDAIMIQPLGEEVARYGRM